MNAYQEGIEAAQRGLDIHDCPYTLGNSGLEPRGYINSGLEDKYLDWFRGYDSARKTRVLASTSPLSDDPLSTERPSRL